MNNITIQNVILQNNSDANFKQYGELFHKNYNGNTGYHMVYDIDKKCSIIKPYDIVDFGTYLNTLQIKEWKEKTYANNFKLKIEYCGKATLEIYELFSNSKTENLNIVKYAKLESKEKTISVIEIPETTKDLICFTLSALSAFEIYNISYVAEVEENEIRDILISIASTTFRKEEYIQKNIELLKTNVLSENSELKNHIFVNVVDNGRTLDPSALECDGLKIHPNMNVGGAGGFARGMIESLKMERKPTHVLLMDDDVLIMPESLFRTYYLLRILKPEYHSRFISGAMFDYDYRETFYEDIGYVHKADGSYGPLKDRMDMRRRDSILNHEKNTNRKEENSYAGWWYCCIPVEHIEENGLPLPVFVRGDDVEFSIRNKAEFLTMNGISIWHVGFGGKFNAAMELYQVHRNSLIIQATSGICEDISFINRIKKLFWKEITRFAYNNCEQLLDSVEDYLKGPDYLINLNGETSIKEHSAKNEKLYPFSSFSHKLNLPIVNPYEYKKLNIIQKVLYVVTINGHLLPNMLLKRVPEVISFDWHFVPGKNYMRKQLVAVNANDSTACMRTIDRRKCFKLIKRYISVMRLYNKNNKKISKDYADNFKKMASFEFWKGYLNI